MGLRKDQDRLRELYGLMAKKTQEPPEPHQRDVHLKHMDDIYAKTPLSDYKID